MTQNNTDSNEQQGESHHLLIVRDHYHVDTLGHIAERRCSCSLSAPLHRYVCAVCVDTRSRAPLAAVEGDARAAFKNACRLHTSWTIDRYLMSNAVNRLDPAEKAERHIDLCKFYVAAVRGCSLENAMSDYGDDFDALHEESQELTSSMDTEIGFPLDRTPNYDELSPKFFECFHAIACRVLGVSRAAASAPLPAQCSECEADNGWHRTACSQHPRFAAEPAQPLCAVHQRLEDTDRLECEIGNDCIACSLNERRELLQLIAPFAAEGNTEDSVTVMRRVAEFYATHVGERRVIVSYPAPAQPEGEQASTSKPAMKRGDAVYFTRNGKRIKATIIDFAPRVFGDAGCNIETTEGWVLRDEVKGWETAQPTSEGETNA